MLTIHVPCGGSNGHISIALARISPSLKLIVQDRPDVVEEARKDIPPNLKDRISFMTHDFFKPQPVKAEAYFYRWTLHDFSDTLAKSIIQNIVPATKDKTRLFINEVVVPAPGDASPVEGIIRLADMGMLMLINGKERTLQEYVDLVRGADSCLKFVSVSHPVGSSFSLIEFIFEADAVDPASTAQPT